MFKFQTSFSSKGFTPIKSPLKTVILPFLKKENAKVHEKYLKFSNELIEYDNFVNNYIIKSNYIMDNQIVINNIINESDFIKIGDSSLEDKFQSLPELHK